MTQTSVSEQLMMHYPFKNPPLPYDYSALEPYIDTQTMQLHHDAHLQTYVNNLNKTLEPYRQFHEWPLQKLIFHASSMPSEISTAVFNNAGGVFNHIFFFDGMIGGGAKQPSGGEFLEALARDFGSFEGFLTEFSKQAAAVFGSGYTYLTMGSDCRLRIINTADQTTPITFKLCPILTIDCWEHAYYLKNHNVRANYIKSFLGVVNWERAEENYFLCKREFGCK